MLLTLAFLGRWSFPLNSRPHLRVLLASAALVNFTIDDTSSLIAYTPVKSWRSSTVTCDSCLQPDAQLAYAETWHDGTHAIPTTDADDLSEDPSTAKGSKAGSQSNIEDAPVLTNTHKKDEDIHSSAYYNRRQEPAERGMARRKVQVTSDLKHPRDRGGDPFFTDKEDGDDTGFVDQPVFALFNFTGASDGCMTCSLFYRRIPRRSAKRCQSSEILSTLILPSFPRIWIGRYTYSPAIIRACRVRCICIRPRPPIRCRTKLYTELRQRVVYPRFDSYWTIYPSGLPIYEAKFYLISIFCGDSPILGIGGTSAHSEN